MKKLIIAVVVVIVLAAGWFFVSPLFIDRQVNEAFDFSTPDGAFDLDAVMEMPEADRMKMKDDIMAAAAAMPDASMSEQMPDSPMVIASGQFVDADAIHKGSGVANLYQLPDERHVIRFEDFRVTNGPALYVYLVKHPDPKTAKDVTDAGFVSLGKLKGNVGSQNYELPGDIDVSEFGSVVVWCQLFGVLFSPASLADDAA